MGTPKPRSRFIYLTLALFLLLSFFIAVSISDSAPDHTDSDDGDGDDDLEGFEELVALDEEEEELSQVHQDQEEGTHQGKPSEAEVLSKAQRIVLELNNDNIRRVIDGNEFVLVLGYAPWCPRSAELMPQFAEAATSLKELGSTLLMAKLDEDRYPKAASVLGIKGVPSLVLFINGSSQAYTGGFTSEEIVIWARKKTGVPVARISSVTEVKEFVKKHSMFVVGLFKKFEGSDYEEFMKAGTADNEIQFVETSDIDIANVLFPDAKLHYNLLGLVKSEPERYAIFEDDFKMEKVLQFLEYNKFPLVNVVNELNSARVYSSPIKLQLYVFAEADDFKDLLNPLQDVARKFKTKIMFIYVDIREDNLAKPFLNLLGLEDSEDTVVAAFDNRISSKYLLESDPTPSKIEEFCVGLLDGTVAPYYKSQPIPDSVNATKEGILIIVGKTFDNLVLSSPKNILLEVHTPWCINCESTSKKIEKLAKHFKGLDDLVFARIDASANEHPKLEVEDYPTLLFYPAGDKSNPIKLSTKSSLKDLAALINKNLKAQGHITKDEL